MKRFFGFKKKAEPPPLIAETADALQVRGDRADKQVQKLDEQLAKFKEQIKNTRPGPAQEFLKKRALQVLKQKRLYESHRDQLYQQQYNMEQTRLTVDNARDTLHTVQALTAAVKEMKAQFKRHGELHVNYIDNIHDDMADVVDMTSEVHEAMGRPYTVPDDIDEGSLLAELDGLEQEFGAEQVAGDSTPSYLQESELEGLPAAPVQEAVQEAAQKPPAVPETA